MVVDHGFSVRVRMNAAIARFKYWFLPVDAVGHEDFVPVGRGVKSGSHCGLWVGLSVCKDVEAHEGKLIGGQSCTGKVVVRHNHLWCHKSSCPVCFIRGWSTREARSIEGRFVAGGKLGFGKVEHVVVSPSVVDRELPEPVMRAKCRGALAARGVVGGNMIFHGYRENKSCTALVWSPHYHVLGYVEGGYTCRACVRARDCFKGCGGFEDRTRTVYESDGCIVRVLAERKTVYGTAWYQLNHATVRVGLRRFHSVTWFGTCNYSAFRSERLKLEVVCPACKGKMRKSGYAGKRCFVKDIGSADYVPLFVDDEFGEDGSPNYPDSVRACALGAEQRG